MSSSLISAIKRFCALRLVVLAASLFQCVDGSTLDVSLDTTPLVGSAAGPFFLYFSFVDGEGFGDGNNDVRITGFDFDAGVPLGGGVSLGDASGSLFSGLLIRDSSFLSIYFESFVPGNILHFSIRTTDVVDPGGVPDRLVFAILDGLGSPLPTEAPNGDVFFTLDLGGPVSTFAAFRSDSSRPSSSGQTFLLDAPVITEVPEPSVMQLSLPLALAAIGRFRRGRSANADHINQ